MKVESNKPEFQPIVLAITLETKKEAEAFFSLHNHPQITGYLREFGIESGTIRKAIGSEYNSTIAYESLLDRLS